LAKADQAATVQAVLDTWQDINITPLPYQGVGIAEPLHIAPGNPLIGYVDDMEGDILIAGAIVVVDLATGKVRQVSTDHISGSSPPRTDGRYVIWGKCDYVKNHPLKYVGGISVFDLETDQLFQIADEQCPSRLDIHDGVAVWDNNQLGVEGRDIFGYNLNTGQAFTLTNRPGHQVRAQTDGDWVVYKDKIENGAREQLYAHNLATSEEWVLGQTWQSLSNMEYDYYDLDAGRVVWLGANSQIHLTNLSTRQDQVLTAVPADCHPALLLLSGDILIGGCGSLGYDLAQDVLFSLPLLPPDFSGQSISGGGLALSNDRIAWIYTLDGEVRLYVAQILH
jgi:hypothetical protein